MEDAEPEGSAGEQLWRWRSDPLTVAHVQAVRNDSGSGDKAGLDRLTAFLPTRAALTLLLLL